MMFVILFANVCDRAADNNYRPADDDCYDYRYKYIIVKKLNSLKHLVGMTVAESHN